MVDNPIERMRLEMRRAHDGGMSYAELGSIINRSAAYVLRVIRGDLLPCQEAVWRWQAFQEGETIILDQAPVCPIHGYVHVVERCHGKEGTPTILAPDERIVRRKGVSRRKRYLRLAVGDLPPEVLAWWRGLTLQQRAAVIASAAEKDHEA